MSTDQFGQERAWRMEEIGDGDGARELQEIVPAQSQSILPLEARYTVSFEDLAFTVKVREGGQMVDKAVMRDLSGVCRPGHFTAVMGPSGSGKSLLLSILAGTIASSRYEGRVRFNGRPRPRLSYRFASFVAQRDALLPSLTVRETLAFAASCKLSCTKRERDDLVTKVIEELGLAAAADTKVGGAVLRGLSGGQRRRLSIGIELVAKNRVLFLDAPTSGLDSTTALRIMLMLRDLASRGRTIVAAVNQPSSKMYQLFDRIMLLAHGRMMFAGDPKAAIAFFDAAGFAVPRLANPADFFLTRVNDDFPAAADTDQLAALYRESDAYRAIADEIAAPAEAMVEQFDKYAVGRWVQLQLLLERNHRNAARNPLLYWLRVVMYAGLAVVMGTIFFDPGAGFAAQEDRLSCIAFLFCFFSFMSVAAVPAFLEEKEVFVREVRSGTYGFLSYTVANTLSGLPWLFLISVLSSIGVYFLAGLNTGADHFFVFVLVLFAALVAAESVMVCISSVVDDALIGVFAGSGVYGAFVLLSGFFVPERKIPDLWIWLYRLSTVKYGLDAALYNEYDGVVVKNAPTESGEMKGHTYLEQRFGIDSDVIGESLAILIGMTVFYRLLFAALLTRFAPRSS